MENRGVAAAEALPTLIEDRNFQPAAGSTKGSEEPDGTCTDNENIDGLGWESVSQNVLRSTRSKDRADAVIAGAPCGRRLAQDLRPAVTSARFVRGTGFRPPFFGMLLPGLSVALGRPDDAMTTNPSSSDQALDVTQFDFVRHLALRLGVEERAARETLGRWMAKYEPVKSSNVSRAPRRAPASGVFPRPGAEEAGRQEEATAA